MKSFIALGAAIILSVLLVGCGGPSPSDQPPAGGNNGPQGTIPGGGTQNPMGTNSPR